MPKDPIFFDWSFLISLFFCLMKNCWNIITANDIFPDNSNRFSFPTAFKCGGMSRNTLKSFPRKKNLIKIPGDLIKITLSISIRKMPNQKPCRKKNGKKSVKQKYEKLVQNSIQIWKIVKRTIWTSHENLGKNPFCLPTKPRNNKCIEKLCLKKFENYESRSYTHALSILFFFAWRSRKSCVYVKISLIKIVLKSHFT